MLKILVSACLLGINTKYNGSNNKNEKIIELLKRKDIILIPVCPEQLAGLPTPREPADLTGDGLTVLLKKAKVISHSGNDLTSYFIKGAYETLKIAKLYNVKLAILKARSPSCGVKGVYEYHSKILKPWNGVTTALLLKEGIKVVSDEQFSQEIILKLIKNYRN